MKQHTNRSSQFGTHIMNSHIRCWSQLMHPIFFDLAVLFCWVDLSLAKGLMPLGPCSQPSYTGMINVFGIVAPVLCILLFIENPFYCRTNYWKDGHHVYNIYITLLYQYYCCNEMCNSTSETRCASQERWCPLNCQQGRCTFTVQGFVLVPEPMSHWEWFEFVFSHLQNLYNFWILTS